MSTWKKFFKSKGGSHLSGWGNSSNGNSSNGSNSADNGSTNNSSSIHESSIHNNDSGNGSGRAGTPVSSISGAESGSSSLLVHKRASQATLNKAMQKMTLEPEVITKNLESTDPVMADGPGEFGDEPAEQKHAAVSYPPGLLTVKIYSSRNLEIPVPMRVNKQILGKLASLGANVDTQEMQTKIDALNETLDAAASTNLSYFLPSTLKIGSGESRKPESGEKPADAAKPIITTYSLVYSVVEVENSSERISSVGNTIASTRFNSVTTFDVSSPRTATVAVHVYVRIPGSLLESNKQEDYLLGTVRWDLASSLQKLQEKGQKLGLDGNSGGRPVSRLLNHAWLHLINPYTDKEISGTVNITLDFKPLSKHAKRGMSIEDFDLLKVIGKGSFGKVMQVRKKDTGKIYALKSIRKAHIVNKMEVTHTLAEKFVLSRVNSPFIVPLKFAFQSSEKLYLVLSFINGGELFYHLQKARRFPLIRAKFYICELLSAIETLHFMNIVYRDLKPENILLDYQGHIALCDFGLCKVNMRLDQKTNTFCGTPEYLAPELLLGKGYTRAVDFWTLGILLYEMLTSLPPFYDEDVNVMYRKILNDPLVFPAGFDSTTKDLITKLLVRDPTKRLGFHGVSAIKTHPFFKDIDWNKLNSKGYIPPYKPQVKDSLDISNISSEFTNEKPMDSVVDDYLSESVQKQFGGWTYVGSFNGPESS